MRPTVVRLIAGRELRDQLRDRRTLFMILGLPVLMYPLFVGVGVLFTITMKEKRLAVGVVGANHLPQPAADPLAAVAGTAATGVRPRVYPPLLVEGRFPAKYTPQTADDLGGVLVVVPLDLAADEALAARTADAVLVVEPDFAAKLERGERPRLAVEGREGEENSKLAVRRVTGILRAWAADVRAVRFARRGLPPDFDSPVEIRDPQTGKSTETKVADEIRDTLVKVIPFLLVMWIMTGSIYPAIDITAGEKERGTMETLLISPAERTEIVAGKFLAVTAIGFGTGVWNVLLMAAAVAVVQVYFPYTLMSLGGLTASVATALPLAMLFAAGCIALGVFARTTKEGNYYMVPIFFVVLPLGYWSMAPGIELDGVTSWVPVTNALLVQQRLLAVRSDPFPWQHLPAVVVSLSAAVGLALGAAVAQFRREAVLFREAEHGGGKWRLFGRKAAS